MLLDVFALSESVVKRTSEGGYDTIYCRVIEVFHMTGWKKLTLLLSKAIYIYMGLSEILYI